MDGIEIDLRCYALVLEMSLDGIALAAGVDDYGWSLALERSEPVKGGAVRVHVKSMEKQ